MTKTLLISLDLAFALSLVFPEASSPVPMSVLFILATVVIFLFLKSGRIIREKKRDMGAGLFAGIFSAGMFVSGLSYFAGPEVISQIPQAAQVIFTSDWALMGWMLVPLLVLSLT